MAAMVHTVRFKTASSDGLHSRPFHTLRPARARLSVAPNAFVETPIPNASRGQYMSEPTTRLDAREIDGEPFGDIMSSLEELEDGDTLLLINSFEPVPLYQVLERRGFGHETEHIDEEEWHVTISHD